MTVTRFVQPDMTAQLATSYKANIDSSINVVSRHGAAFAPSEQLAPNMTVLLQAGYIWNGTNMTQVSSQSCGTLTAPVTNPRIDRIVVDSTTGAVSIIAGTENASPTAPALTAGKIPVAQVRLTVGMTSITNAALTDERGVLMYPASAGTALLLARGTTIASAATCDIGAADSDYIDISGTTAITSLGTTITRNHMWLTFQGALTLTHNGTSLILPGAANITTAAGDIGEFVRISGGNWKCVGYTRATGKALVAPTSADLASVVLAARGTTIASASTVDLGAADSDYVDISGTTTINNLGSTTTRNHVWATFQGILTLTHNATSLILPGAANITTAAGDIGEFVRISGSNWKCIGITRASGKSLTAPTAADLSTVVLAARGTTIASASTTDIGAADSDNIDISGTTTINNLGSATTRNHLWLTFQGILTLTYNATSLILPTAANIVTAAGDIAEFVRISGSNWKCVSYTRASGAALATSGGAGLTRVGTQHTPTGVATDDFTSIPQTGNDLIIQFTGISNATATRIFRIKPGIAGVFGGSDVYKKSHGPDLSNSNDNVHTDLAGISFMQQSNLNTQAAAETTSGILTIKDYASTSIFKHFTMVKRSHIGGTESLEYTEGIFANLSAIDSIRCYWSSSGASEAETTGNFDAGTIDCFIRT